MSPDCDIRSSLEAHRKLSDHHVRFPVLCFSKFVIVYLWDYLLLSVFPTELEASSLLTVEA